jgi:hypothetical protein
MDKVTSGGMTMANCFTGGTYIQSSHEADIVFKDENPGDFVPELPAE